MRKLTQFLAFLRELLFGRKGRMEINQQSTENRTRWITNEDWLQEQEEHQFRNHIWRDYL
ncbi:MAG TPA: hypothetical protein DCS07_13755 [Bdellovibrionales bacterium]|nr:MAG: hypothetical protein A2Z97_03590 [Bdellovibrionales bacterium GWB1_52_6]OFZ04022.1 MAG: hypothetical protein A2X97_14560 [Bdellovibrionales bacterium GWA1_52_35]OFZ39768.1 MAG: hypothetical protein A2070_01105 [Bdellovibrionales bacterium GWC1_52_8]HAR43674.1 hypothetical protein [Bdellovibrionales bacterium]HCM39893.1 hypothetical protein [Bdellovibrionales bacterium]